jgi:hypothetical protein
MNLEDGAPHQRREPRHLVDLNEQLEKIAAVMETKRLLGSDFFLNARVDAFMVITDDPKKALDESIRRGNRYAEAGADCIFYMNVVSRDTIASLVKAVKAPVSILARPEAPSAAELQELGVACQLRQCLRQGRHRRCAPVGYGDPGFRYPYGPKECCVLTGFGYFGQGAKVVWMRDLGSLFNTPECCSSTF